MDAECGTTTVGPVEELIDRTLAEDLGSGDVTTALVVPEGAEATAQITQKAPGVLAGLEVARAVFERVDPAVRWHASATEGEWREGGEVATVEGPAASLLAGERTALNLLGRLSGVATLTARYVKAVEGTGAQILDTRKTTPGLRELEKRAVVTGGGLSHRAGLFDAVLVKENHAALAGGVGPAARAARAGAPRGMRSRSSAGTSGRSGRRSTKGSLGYSSTTWRPASSARLSRWRRDAQTWRPPAG